MRKRKKRKNGVIWVDEDGGFSGLESQGFSLQRAPFSDSGFLGEDRAWWVWDGVSGRVAGFLHLRSSETPGEARRWRERVPCGGVYYWEHSASQSHQTQKFLPFLKRRLFFD
jgi:hypothetical protein